jgi:hypothetical protein
MHTYWEILAHRALAVILLTLKEKRYWSPFLNQLNKASLTILGSAQKCPLFLFLRYLKGCNPSVILTKNEELKLHKRVFKLLATDTSQNEVHVLGAICVRPASTVMWQGSFIVFALVCINISHNEIEKACHKILTCKIGNPQAKRLKKARLLEKDIQFVKNAKLSPEDTVM